MPRISTGGPRDAALSVRVPTRVRYGLELAARLHNERLPDLIVQALTDSLTSEVYGLFVDLPGEDEQVNLLPRVWDARESTRLVKLAIIEPSLLTPAERGLWQIVRQQDRFWKRASGVHPIKAAESERRIEDLKAEELELEWSDLKEALGRARALGSGAESTRPA